MKSLNLTTVIICLIVLFAVAVFAAPPASKLQSTPDGQGGKVLIQGHASNGKKAQNLTVNNTIVDHRPNASWELYTPNDCKFALQSTATKGGLTRTWSGGIRSGQVVNAATPFVRYSGCTSGELDAM